MIHKKKYCFLMPLKASPASVCGVVFLRGIQALESAVLAVLTASIVDHASEVVRGGSISAIIPQLTILLMLILFQFSGNTLMSLLYTRIRTRIRECFDREILKKVSLLPYHSIEDKGTYELTNRVGKDYEVKVTDGFRTYLRAAGNALQLVSILYVIIRTGQWWSAIVLLIFSVPLVSVSMLGGRKNYDASVQAAVKEQQAAYLNEVLIGRETALERIFFGFSDWVQDKWREQFRQAQKLQNHAQAQAIVRMKLGSILTVVVSVAVCAMLVPALLEREISLGIFFGLTTAIFNFVTLVSWEVADTFNELGQSRAYSADFARFFDLDEESVAEGGMPVAFSEDVTVTFENVTFHYPGCKDYVLQDVNMTLQSGKHYAVVGANGAGKSTLVKLMCGLYTDYDGIIRINGKDVREIPSDSLRKYFSIAWQDFARYSIPLHDYLELGGEADEEMLWELLRLFGMERLVRSWPEGLGTPLGKVREGGQEISQGQWQRLMIVKHYCKEEPSKYLTSLLQQLTR